jgi:hypothetical protein
LFRIKTTRNDGFPQDEFTAPGSAQNEGRWYDVEEDRIQKRILLVEFFGLKNFFYATTWRQTK